MSLPLHDINLICYQIAQREAEVEKVVLQARQGSDRRVRATSRRCNAENELEEALLELTVREMACFPLCTLGDECTLGRNAGVNVEST